MNMSNKLLVLEIRIWSATGMWENKREFEDVLLM